MDNGVEIVEKRTHRICYRPHSLRLETVTRRQQQIIKPCKVIYLAIIRATLEHAIAATNVPLPG